MALVELGLHHEQQHQELLLMDIKHVLSCNPLRPSYRSTATTGRSSAPRLEWCGHDGGLVEVGASGDSFAFDNESPRHAQFLAADVGGTQMRAALVDRDGTVAHRRVQATPRGARCPDALLALVGELVAAAEVAGAVVGLPGRVDYATGRLEDAPNLPESWPAALTEEQLGPVVGVPVALANDADLAAVGEAYFGAGRPYHDVVYLTLSTGVGAGVVVGGRLVHGRRSLAEVGHTVIDWQAARRGEPATLEALASGSALARLGTGSGIVGGATEVTHLAAAGQPDARAVFTRVVRAAAVGVVNLAYLYSPEVVVIGGGLGLVGGLLLDPVRAYLADHGPPGLAVDVVGAALGDDAALAGAAAWRVALGAEGVVGG